MMILLIDNYDSFTFNLYHLIGGAGYDVTVMRNDALAVDEAISMDAEAIVLSPGPGLPDQAGICLDVVRRAAQTNQPVFGVCLGLQSIAQALGGTIERAAELKHGKTSVIRHTGSDLFQGIPNDFTGTRYHSLVAAASTLPKTLDITASSVDDDEIMAVEHKNLPIAGVQFHPESIASEYGRELFVNFMTSAKGAV